MKVRLIMLIMLIRGTYPKVHWTPSFVNQCQGPRLSNPRSHLVTPTFDPLRCDPVLLSTCGTGPVTSRLTDEWAPNLVHELYFERLRSTSVTCLRWSMKGEDWGLFIYRWPYLLTYITFPLRKKDTEEVVHIHYGLSRNTDGEKHEQVWS